MATIINDFVFCMTGDIFIQKQGATSSIGICLLTELDGNSQRGLVIVQAHSRQHISLKERPFVFPIGGICKDYKIYYF